MRFIGFPKAAFQTAEPFCNDARQPERLVRLAIDRGMTSIGFSARSRVSFLPEEGMDPTAEQRYRKEIADLKTTYGDRIRVYCGVERDFYSDLPPIGYDFVIGSVGYIRAGEAYCSVFEAPRRLRTMIDRHFSSDAYAFLRTYLNMLAELPQRTACDVVSGLEAVLRWNGEEYPFEWRDVRYRKCVFDAIDSLLEQDVILEIDTERFLADVRRSSRVYLQLLRYLAEKRGRVTLTADVTEASPMNRSFAQAAHLCRSVGLGSVFQLTPRGWQSVAL